MIQSKGYAAQTKAAPLTPFSFERRDPGPGDVVVEILYSGICHSDIHQVQRRVGRLHLPHGSRPRDRRPRHRRRHRRHPLQPRRPRRRRRHGRFLPRLRTMQGAGRSLLRKGLRRHLQRQRLRFRATSRRAVTPTTSSSTSATSTPSRQKLESKLAAVAPLLCAGITTYSPLKHWKVGPGSKVGIIGLGGLGHMGLKFAHSFGADVTLFTTSAGKEADAKRLGADEVVISKDKEAMAAQKGKFDFLLDCVSAPHDLNEYLALLRARTAPSASSACPRSPSRFRPSPPSPTAAASPAP